LPTEHGALDIFLAGVYSYNTRSALMQGATYSAQSLRIVNSRWLPSYHIKQYITSGNWTPAVKWLWII